MDIELDRDSEVPVGVQLAWALRTRILGGELGAGDRLPGVRELAASTKVNVNTVRAVYARLETEGLTHTEHGRGTFVSANAPTDGRLAAIARRALADAQSAGVDPRELAAALFGGAGLAGAPPSVPFADGSAERRRALRDEISALERDLADARLARALRDADTTPPRGAGGRLLGEDELRAIRDDLAARIAAVDEPPAPELPVQPSTRSSTRPGVAFRPVFGT